MEFVGADTVPNGAEAVQLRDQFSGELGRRPRPEIAILQPRNDRACWIGRAKKGDNPSLHDP